MDTSSRQNCQWPLPTPPYTLTPSDREQLGTALRTFQSFHLILVGFLIIPFLKKLVAFRLSFKMPTEIFLFMNPLSDDISLNTVVFICISE
jgi:hypothetical protein